MNINRFTERVQQALSAAQTKVVRYGHQQIDVEHLLVALLEQEHGVVRRWTGVPVSRLLAGEIETLLHLADELHKRVAGQDEAVTAVPEAVIRARSGMQDPNRVRQRLAEREIRFELTPEARTHLVHTGYDPHYGARPLKRAIQRDIETPLGVQLLKGAVRDGQTVIVDYDPDSGTLTFTPQTSEAEEEEAVAAREA